MAYQPTGDELNILARTECLILWDRLASGGANDKYLCIERLYAEGKLCSDFYKYGCPFCHFLRDYLTRNINIVCSECLWPAVVSNESFCRCADDESPYEDWAHATNRSSRRKAARKVFKLIWDIEI